MGEVFDGKIVQDGRKNFIEQTQSARKKRAEVMQRQEAAIVIVRFLRRAVVRKRFLDRTKAEFLHLMESFNPEQGQLITCLDFYERAYQLMRRNWHADANVLDLVCRYINWSSAQKNSTYCYIGVGIMRDKAVDWTGHIRDIVCNCLSRLKQLRPHLCNDVNKLALILSTIVCLTSIDKWPILTEAKFKFLAEPMGRLTKSVIGGLKSAGLISIMHDLLEQSLSRPGQFPLRKSSLWAITKLVTLTYQPADGEVDCDAMKEMILQIFSIPCYIHYLHAVCPEALDKNNFPQMLRVAAEQNLSEQVNANDALCILANFVQLGEYCGRLNDVFYPHFAKLINNLILNNGLKKCETSKTAGHYHSVLGWIDCPVRQSVLQNMDTLKEQLALLWGPAYQEAVFGPLYTFLATYATTTPPEHSKASSSSNQTGTVPPQSSSKSTAIFKSSLMKVFRRALFLDATQGSSAALIRLTADVTVHVSEACKLYHNIAASLSLFASIKVDFLTGICFKQSSKLLIALWQFLKLTGVGVKDSAVKSWAELLLHHTDPVQEHLLALSTDAMTHYITILDDQEFYDDQPVFRIDELRQIAGFLNQLCYRLITHSNYTMVKDSTWASVKTLLVALYRRDCRKRYCPEDHWLVDSTKMNQLIVDIEKGRKHAKRVLSDMPHVLREDHRVILFRKWATSEKTLNGSGSASSSLEDIPSTSTLITIHRSRIVEDGYAQLATLSPNALKGTIRVRFQNELGLDEAGIDQDGVFKEFLEETINQVFNPSLNLFKATTENLLYPSPTSFVHEHHQLFEFVGKMLAKAIFEGIVVDVHFAPFFLSLMLGHQQSPLFSATDELQSLDKELHTSMNYVKHYEGDVSELEFTFSVDQDFFGELRTTELIPGGKNIRVTNHNKISYLYQMANFHLHTQIKKQTQHFVDGFKSVIPQEWLRIFSPLELQRLISGEDSDIDLVDLRRNTQYYGGFHDNHRVILWLWEILENDFVEDERRLFLKFVTSCSKPPLLGFVNLDPPFSIRCVEVSDDEDTGDTLGSVLRGFLTIGKRDPVGRLPTSSTCFNLLKLPNYQKKSTLRDKLRYAITAHVGFELS